MTDTEATPSSAAPQHGDTGAQSWGPRPLPLFLAMLAAETAGDAGGRAAALAGLRAYQEADRGEAVVRPPTTLTSGRAGLRCYAGARRGTAGPPVVVIPSLINPATVLDLTAGRSLMRWLGSRGHEAWLLDWGEPAATERGLDLAGHIETLLLPLLDALGEPPVLVGYCLGGTLAIAAAARRPVRGVATIASPWRFAGYGAARNGMMASWRTAEPACAALGLVPIELLQAGFWRLDPARTVTKFAAFGRLDPASEAARRFIALEDWANAGAPLTHAAGRDLFEAMVGDDAAGRGAWRVGGVPVDPDALGCPTVEFVSLTDRIVPAATAVGWRDRRDIAAGHVGMMVGGGAEVRLWRPLAEWVEAL